MANTVPLALYVHLPWCLRKCPYCDFNAHAHSNPPFVAYTRALIADLQTNGSAWHGRELVSIFFGGGTPSIFPARHIAQILAAAAKLFVLTPDCEISLEANPAVSVYQRFRALRACGVNRLSLGLQSFDAQQLAKLGRVHSVADNHSAVHAARRAGFDNINIDLMYGLPTQSDEQAAADLQQALDYQPEHLSWYQLNIETNTIFYSQTPSLPNALVIDTMERTGHKLLRSQNYQHYEISAFARDGKQCQHNLNYWNFGDYLGVGAGAHSKLSSQGQIWRETRPKRPESYMQPNMAVARQTVPTSELALEFMLNALRLKRGVPQRLFNARTGLSLKSMAAQLQSARAAGLLHRQRLQASARGWRFLNDTLQHFHPD